MLHFTGSQISLHLASQLDELYFYHLCDLDLDALVTGYSC